MGPQRGRGGVLGAGAGKDWALGRTEMRILVYLPFETLRREVKEAVCAVCLSMGFSRQEYCSGLPCPPPGDLSHPGIKSESPALISGLFTGSAI